jgi:hypothetical protein
MFEFLRKLGQENMTAEEKADLEALGSAMAGFGEEIDLNEWIKKRIKSNLFQNIAESSLELPVGLKEVGEVLQRSGQKNYLTAGQKHLIYCRIRENQLEKKGWDFSMLARTFKTAVASVLIAAFGLTFFVISPFDLRLTKAAKWTFLEDVRGEVFVNRDGRILSVNKDFALEEGDLVFTRGDSFVVIRFLDDSIARLGENTSLEIKKLYARPENLVNTEVELSLVGGQLWASVYNLVDDESKFVVETENALAKVNSKAAFEMKAEDKSTTLAVFDNVVDFRKKSSRIGQVQPVVSGFKAEIDSGNVYQLSYNNHDVVVQRNLDGVDAWARMNMDLDQKHLQTLKKENEDFISQAASKDSLVGALADFKDNTKLMFNNANIEKARIKFNDAQVGFMKAQQILNDSGFNMDKRREALPLIYTYKTAIKEIMGNFAALQKEDAKQANQLFEQMKESVDVQRKLLSLVMPDESLYTAKYVLNEVAGNFAINDSEKAQYLLAEARDRLMEVETLINKNDLKRAEASFRSYLSDIDDLVSQMSSFKVAEVEPQLFALIDEQIKQFKVLNAIEKKLAEKDDKILLALVNRVNSSSLQKLITIFKAYRKNGIPFEMLAELKNTIGSYYPEGKEKAEALMAMTDLMKVYPEYKELQKEDTPDLNNVTNQPAVVVDFEATKDITMDDQVGKIDDVQEAK